jgi:cell filamentation protein
MSRTPLKRLHSQKKDLKIWGSQIVTFNRGKVAYDKVKRRDQITRYRVAAGPESEYEPGSRGRVLKNRLGLIHKREIDRAEYESLVKAQEASLYLVTKNTVFTERLICKMHRDWLGRIYKWAGSYRTVELSKSGFRWPPAYLIGSHMKEFEDALLREYTPCKPGLVSEVAMAMAKVHAEFLLIHPFRDGNGRMARWLSSLMALQADHPTPEYHFAGRASLGERNRYLGAVMRGYLKDYAPLADFFAEALLRRKE